MTSLSAGRGQTSLIKGQTSLIFGQTSASALNSSVPGSILTFTAEDGQEYILTFTAVDGQEYIATGSLK